MNKTEQNKVMSLYKDGGMTEALVTEIFIRKHLSYIPGAELDSPLMERYIREASTIIDIFYKTVVFERWRPLTTTEKGQNLTAQLTKLVDDMPVNSEKVLGDKIED